MNSRRGKILVIRGGAIGDFILTLPAITALRRQFPQAHLEVLGHPHIVQLAIAGDLVDRASSIEAQPLAGFFARNGDLAEELSEYFSEFDIIVSYLYDPDEVFKDNIARCSPAQFIAGPHRPDENSGVHAARVYLKPLERLAIFEDDFVPRLHLEGRTKALQTPPTDFPDTPGLVQAMRLALHPGSGSDKKNWPEEKWAELLERIVNQTSVSLLLVGGEAEGERLQRLAAALPPRRTRVAKSLPLAELARALTRCQGFVGHDSGISHLAAALGLPAILLWGNTREAIWKPPGEQVVLVRDPGGLANLKVDTVFQAAQSLWLAD